MKTMQDAQTKEVAMPMVAPTTGFTLVEVAGANFGNNIATMQFDGHQIENVNYVNDDSLKFNTPAGLGAGHEITVHVDGQISKAYSFDYAKPVLRNFELVSGGGLEKRRRR